MPPYSESDCLIYLHIPKTGGSTLGSWLSNNFSDEEIDGVSWGNYLKGLNDILRIPPERRTVLRALRGHQPYGNHHYLGRRGFYITFLRDPVERTLSHYYFLTKAENADALIPILTERRNLWNGLPLHWLFENFQTRWLSNAIFGYQYESDDAMLEAALRNLNHMTVGLTEHFEESIKALSIILHLDCLDFENRKVSNRPNRERHSAELLERVEEHNRLDRQLYGRAKERFQELCREAEAVSEAL